MMTGLLAAALLGATPAPSPAADAAAPPARGACQERRAAPPSDGAPRRQRPARPAAGASAADAPDAAAAPAAPGPAPAEKAQRDARRRAVEAEYEAPLRALEAQERRERDEAIARLEEFVARYPEFPGDTPEALLRLAELRYEEANERYARALERWRGAAERGGAGPDAPEPQKDFGASVQLYRRILASFPAFPQCDAVQYLLAYALGEMGEAEESARAYADLLERYPKSAFVPEAWLRVGDHLFDDDRPGALERAAAAFSKVRAFPDHPLYPRALYKLGWTYYRLDRHAEAVEAFTKLLDHDDAAAGAAGRAPDGDAWPEAIQYTAVCFADRAFGGVEKARAWFTSLGGRGYAREVYLRLGDILSDEARFPEAVQAYELALAADPLAADAPRVQARIVQAWSRERRPEDELRARERLVERYAEEGAWSAKHRGDAALAADARALVEESLGRAAALHHEAARAHRQAGRAEAAVAEYRAAAKVYRHYLERFPRARTAYDLAYALADCLYNAGDWEAAAAAYRRVRDDPADDRYLADSAFSAVLSWQRAADEARRGGRLEARPVLTSRDRRGEPGRPRPLPPLLAEEVKDADLLVALAPGHEKAAATAYHAGELYYAYDDFDEARCRLEEVVARWPSSPVAQFAANLVIETHLATRDWAGVEAASARLQQGDAAAKNRALGASLQRFKLGGRFNRAMQLMDAGRWEEAADLFTALVAEDPSHEFADKALFNAATCHERARRFESALSLQERIYREYPASGFADEALFRVAWNAENAYDFDKAVERYLLLVDRYPASKGRKDALYNAARCLESLQRYEEAARAFARYAELYPTAEDAARTQFHAALIYEKTRDHRRETQALADFVRCFAGSKEHELLVQAHLKSALAQAELGDARAARAGYEAALAEYARRGLDPDRSPAGAAAAAEARFRLAELQFERFDAIRLPSDSNPKKLKKALDAKLAELKKVAPLYNEVKRYRRPDWTLAAFYRQAFLLERLAQTLYEAPVPPELKQPGHEEYLAAYQDQLAQVAQPYEDQAVQVYVQAIQAARELHVKNAWTKRVAESLARYRPKEYPILQDPRGRLAPVDLAAAPLAEAIDGPVKRAAGAAAPGRHASAEAPAAGSGGELP